MDASAWVVELTGAEYKTIEHIWSNMVNIFHNISDITSILKSLKHQ
jgi:hypothetical protein